MHSFVCQNSHFIQYPFWSPQPLMWLRALRWYTNLVFIPTATMVTGGLFQKCAVATGNARPPMVDSLNGGIRKRFGPAEWSAGRPDTSATWIRGEPPCTVLYVRTAILYSIRSGVRNQCVSDVVASSQMIHQFSFYSNCYDGYAIFLGPPCTMSITA